MRHVTNQGLKLDFIDLVAVNSILVLYSLFNKSKGLLEFHRYSVKCFKTNRQATASQNSWYNQNNGSFSCTFASESVAKFLTCTFLWIRGHQLAHYFGCTKAKWFQEAMVFIIIFTGWKHFVDSDISWALFSKMGYFSWTFSKGDFSWTLLVTSCGQF